MRSETLCATLFLTVGFAACAFAQAKDSCTTLMDIKVTGVEITKAADVEAGSTEPIPWNQSRSAPVPAYCRVEGVIHRRTAVGGEEFWNHLCTGDVRQMEWRFPDARRRRQQWHCPGAAWVESAGDNPGLIRGFAIASTDTGQKSHHAGFDFGFMRDQQAYLDFAYLANAGIASHFPATFSPSGKQTGAEREASQGRAFAARSSERGAEP